jgi:hypothetical protein
MVSVSQVESRPPAGWRGHALRPIPWQVGGPYETGGRLCKTGADFSGPFRETGSRWFRMKSRRNSIPGALSANNELGPLSPQTKKCAPFRVMRPFHLGWKPIFQFAVLSFHLQVVSCRERESGPAQRGERWTREWEQYRWRDARD